MEWKHGDSRGDCTRSNLGNTDLSAKVEVSDPTTTVITRTIPWGALGVSLVLHLTGLGIGASIWLTSPAAESNPSVVLSTEVEPAEQPSIPLTVSTAPWQPTESGGSPNPLAAAIPSEINTDRVLSVTTPLAIGTGEQLNFTEIVGDGGSGGGPGTGEGAGTEDGFFGLDISGERVVFVVDASRSMAAAYPGDARNRLGRVKIEIYNAVSRMSSDQRFFVIFFNTQPIPMPARELVPANPAILRPYMEWIFRTKPEGQTDPEAALLLALKLNPDRVYFLTDGYFSPGTVRKVREANRGRVPIHTVGFGGKEGETNLQAIARDSQATYQFIPTPPLPDEPNSKPPIKAVSDLQKAAAAIAKPK